MCPLTHQTNGTTPRPPTPNNLPTHRRRHTINNTFRHRRLYNTINTFRHIMRLRENKMKTCHFNTRKITTRRAMPPTKNNLRYVALYNGHHHDLIRNNTTSPRLLHRLLTKGVHTLNNTRHLWGHLANNEDRNMGPPYILCYCYAVSIRRRGI